MKGKTDTKVEMAGKKKKITRMENLKMEKKILDHNSKIKQIR